MDLRKITLALIPIRQSNANSINKNLIVDNHGRTINYLRLAVTDRCNLRCSYCMPKEGLDWLSRKELMTFEEMLRICSVLIAMGIQKIRITGGEPFVRKDLMNFLSGLKLLKGLKQVSITTNGVLTAPLIPELIRTGINCINLSLDTLDPKRFFAITRRDEFAAVINTLQTALQYDMEVKINAVVMEGKNTEDILTLAELTKDLPVAVRFIEEMPFNGTGHTYSGIIWDYRRIIEKLKDHFPSMSKLKDPASSTSLNYAIPGHRGTVGVIPAYTRSFCGTCNRIRLTPEGMLKTCLYDNGVLNIKDLVRLGLTDQELANELSKSMQKKMKTGWEAERNGISTTHPSMAAIGG
jgi:molybdenum cofactor biosynthesis protein A